MAEWIKHCSRSNNLGVHLTDNGFQGCKYLWKLLVRGPESLGRTGLGTAVALMPQNRCGRQARLQHPAAPLALGPSPRWSLQALHTSYPAARSAKGHGGRESYFPTFRILQRRRDCQKNSFYIYTPKYRLLNSPGSLIQRARTASCLSSRMLEVPIPLLRHTSVISTASPHKHKPA